MPPSSTAPRPARPPAPLAIVGPTAGGKSDLALALAERVGGEIVSVDSMQVYCGLDIGTAKPTVAELARVRHHLINVAELTEAFDAARFLALAEAAEQDIRARGKVPIYCGGTGLYLKVLMEGLGEAPPSDDAIRAELEAAPLAELLRELEAKDPVCFAVIDRKNPRRVVRALEVIRVTGRPFSAQRAEWTPRRPDLQLGESEDPVAPAASAVSPAAGSEPRLTLIGLRRSPEDLHRRIGQRVDAMFAAGLVEETRQLLKKGLEQNRTALQAIGYRQVAEHLRGERGLKETVELVKTKTRQFAKRQMTWFRNQLPVQWIDVEPRVDVANLAAQLTAAFSASSSKS
jgi:tRNA dimethylallyltransferase